MVCFRYFVVFLLLIIEYKASPVLLQQPVQGDCLHLVVTVCNAGKTINKHPDVLVSYKHTFCLC